jgi:hypothetical protein
LALALHALGRVCIVEPGSRISACSTHHERLGAWSEGRSAEMLYWKHFRNARGVYALHALGLAGEFVAALPRPRRLVEFLGRLSVLASVPGASSAAPKLSPSSSASVEPVRRRDGANLVGELRPAAHRAVQPY